MNAHVNTGVNPCCPKTNDIKDKRMNEKGLGMMAHTRAMKPVEKAKMKLTLVQI